MDPLKALLRLRERAEGWLDTAPLEALSERLAQPWSVAVVGRVGVGKSSLINAAAGSRICPTGLGGVTESAQTVPLDARRQWIDTPGIDEEGAALTRLTPILERVDAAIWVLDGIQPLTATERRVLHLCRPEDLPLHVVISRRDLVDAAEAEAIFERVQTLTRPLGPASLHHLDLRAPPHPLPSPLITPMPLGPRRRNHARTVLQTLRASLDAAPPAPSRRALLEQTRTQWAQTVHEVRAAIAAEPGATDTAPRALRRLQERAPQAREDFIHQLAPLGLPPPPMPLPDPIESGAVQQMVHALGGVMGANRALAGATARWLAEGEVSLMEWAAAQESLDARHAARKELEAAWQDAHEAIEAADRPLAPAGG